MKCDHPNVEFIRDKFQFLHRASRKRSLDQK